MVGSFYGGEQLIGTDFGGGSNDPPLLAQLAHDPGDKDIPKDTEESENDGQPDGFDHGDLPS